MRPAPLPTVARPRLLARLALARVVVLEAGGGYGKSTLLEQLVAEAGIATVAVDLGGVAPGAAPVLAALRRGVRAAGMGALDQRLAGLDDAAGPREAGRIVADELATRPDPVLVVVDEAGAAADDGIALLAAVVRGCAAPHRVALAGRLVPATVMAEIPDAVRLGPDDLALTVEEIVAAARAAGRPVDEVAAAAVVAATDGWPAAVAVAISEQGTGRRSVAAGLPASLDALLGGAPATRVAAAALSWLPRIDPTTAELAAGPGALEALVAVGLPFRRRADGWLELPEPVREALTVGAPPLGTGRITAVAGAYLDAGEAALALGFLVRSGDPEALAGVLATRSWHELTALDASELRAALATLPDAAIARHPRVLLAAARVAESGVHLAWRSALLERARSLPATAADPVLLREVLVEQAADASRSGDAAAVEALAGEVLAAAGPGEARTRAVALTALGRIDAFSRDPVAMARAADRLREAASLLRPLREPDLLRGALQVLGYGVHFARGDLDAAVDALREAADLVPGAIRTRAGVQTFLADALVAAGRLDDAEAVLRDELNVARRLRDDRLLAYHAWMQASIASRRGDAAAVEAWLAEAERHPADWFAHPTGIEFLADAVDFLGRVELDEEAARMLARVEARCAADGREGIDQIALVARAVFGARAADPAVAERDLVACLGIEQVPPREHWRMHLLRALAASRAGDAATAARHARRSLAMAAAMGHPDLPWLLEPGIAAALQPLLAGVGEGEAEPPAVGPRVRIRVLGRFEVIVDGRLADPPDGKPGQLVKLLAVTGRAMPIDEVVEALWPDADPDLGRQRLRNVLARVRGACGDLVVRADEALSLERGTEVDLERFEAEARAALAEPAGAGEALARAALGRYAGELLPGDRYEGFTAAARERVAVRHIALLDRLAALTAARGDVDEALTLLEEAIAAEPLDERRYRTAIGVAARHGRRDRALRLADRALAMEADLADEPSVELLDLLTELGLDRREAATGR